MQEQLTSCGLNNSGVLYVWGNRVTGSLENKNIHAYLRVDDNIGILTSVFFFHGAPPTAYG